MPSPPSLPFVLSVPKRRVKLVVPSTDSNKGKRRGGDVIPRASASTLADAEAATAISAVSPDNASNGRDSPSIASASTPPTSPAMSLATPAVEPAATAQREALHLPPKSYAEAVVDTSAKTAILDAPHAPPSETPLNATTNGTNGDSFKANGRMHMPSDSERERVHYEGEGLDDTPKSPTASTRGHRRKSSLNSRASSGKHDQHDQHGDLSAVDVHTDIVHTASGKQLTSIKVQLPVYDAHKERDRDRDCGLVSGRQAGAGWKKSKIRWAPLNVPLQRRLQTLMVLAHSLSIAGLLTVFFFLCSIPLLWPIMLPYLIYVLLSNAPTSGELSLRSERWRRSRMWSLFASYFPARLHRSQELEPTRKYIFGYHPHGIISHGAFAAFATEALGFSELFPGITNTLLTLEANFRIPLYREYALRLGLASVSKASIDNLLSKGGANGEGMGRAVTIVVGGARESLEAKPGTLRLILQRRRGFVKIGVRNGADLVPVLAFGENDIYQQVDANSHPLLNKIQLTVKKVMGFTVPLFHARGIFNYDVGMMPYRRPLNVVVGKPIRVVQQDHPDPEYVERLHKEYVDELMRLWHDFKNEFARNRTSGLEIIA